MPPPWLAPGTPPGTPTNTVAQNVVGNAAGFGAIAATNIGMSAVTGSPAVVGIAAVGNVVLQHAKHYKWFREDSWSHPLLMLISTPIALALGGPVNGLHDVVQALMTGAQATMTAVTTYHAAQATVLAGALKPVSPENSYANQGAAVEAPPTPPAPSPTTTGG